MSRQPTKGDSYPAVVFHLSTADFAAFLPAVADAAKGLEKKVRAVRDLHPSADDSLHRGEEFAQRKRLGEGVVRAELPRDIHEHLVVAGQTAGHRDDRRLLIHRAQRGQQLETVGLGHENVREDQPDRILRQEFEGGVAIRHGVHGIAAALEKLVQHAAKRRFVFDEQDIVEIDNVGRSRTRRLLRDRIHLRARSRDGGRDRLIHESWDRLQIALLKKNGPLFCTGFPSGYIRENPSSSRPSRRPHLSNSHPTPALPHDAASRETKPPGSSSPVASIPSTLAPALNSFRSTASDAAARLLDLVDPTPCTTSTDVPFAARR